MSVKNTVPLYKKQFSFLDTSANAFLIAIFGFFPLIVFRDYTNITRAKLITFLCLFFIFAAVVLFVFGGVFLDGYRPKRKPLPSNLPFVFLGIYLLSAVLSFLFSPYRSLKNGMGKSAFLFGSGRYDGFLLLLCYAAAFLLLSFFGSFKKIHILVITGALTVMNIIGIIQTRGINIFKLYPAEAHKGKLDDFVSTVGNIDFFSSIISVFLPIVIFALFLIKLNIFEKIFLFISAALSVYLLFSLNVSSGKLAVTVTACLAVPFLCFVKKKISLRGAVIILAAEALLFAVFLAAVYKFVPVNTGGASVNRPFLTEISNILHGEIDETTGTYRVGIWLSALKMWLKRPIFGTGMGAFMKAFADFTDGELAAFSFGKIDTCHNEYLQILCVGGAVGLASYIGFIISLIIEAFKHGRENPYIWVLLGGMFCYLIQAFFNFSIIITAPVIWAVFGSINNLMRRAENEKNI